MCLILLAWRAHPRYALVLAANRDERHDRASLPAQWWPELPGVFAGRDLVAGGTWLGITRDGRMAALTNHRDLRRPPRSDAESRGALVRDFLTGHCSPDDYLARVAPQAARWSPFNLLVGDMSGVACYGSTDGITRRLSPGVHGLSNHLLDTPWPKVARGSAALQRLLEADALAAPPRAGEDARDGTWVGSDRDVRACSGADAAPTTLSEALFALLANRDTAADAALPDTGLPLARERALSAAMIVDPVYGTRCATVLLFDHQGRWTFQERSFDPAGQLSGSIAACSEASGTTAAAAAATAATDHAPPPQQSMPRISRR